MPELFSKKGFTLVEVMIIAFVLAILTAIAISTYSNVSENAQKSVCLLNQKTIYEAAVLFELGEPDSLINKGQQGRLNALVDRGYIKNQKMFECPSSTIEDFDDYLLVFSGNDLVDVDCETRAEEHVWPEPD
ncbi:MAG: prepilin-type N-terminal cleavage/methylation domain-containing protein [Candidatus Omnitrophota bacterium]